MSTSTPLPFAAIILVIKDGLILAISRRHDKTKFGLPGGSYDESLGDTCLIDTAIRECEEETGVKVGMATLIYERIERGDRKQVDFHSATFYANEWAGEPHNSEEGDVKWLTAEELTSTKAAFGDYNRNMLNAFKVKFPHVKLIGE